MAMLPCGRGPHFNPFRNANYYVAIGSGGDFARWLLRLCPAHAAAVNEDLAQHEVTPDNLALSAGGPATNCLSCGQPMQEIGTQLFVTAYPAKDQRKDYWAHIHVNCRVPVTLQQPDLPLPGIA